MLLYVISLQASVMIAAIAMIRAMGVHRLPKSSFQALWGAALVRLLYPFRIEFRFSLYNAVQWVEQMFYTPSALGTDPMLVEAGPLLAVSQVETGIPSAGSAASFSPWLILWLIPALLLLAYFVLTHCRWRRVYSKALPLLQMRVSALLWSRTLCVETSASIEAPLTYGVLRPIVLLPEALTKGQALNYVLAHEIAHIRHWDALKKWLLTLALCVHWFNPLVWVMYLLANRDMELSCDATVLRELGEDEKARYASMLIDMEEARSGLTPLVSHFSKNSIEERIIGIMKYKKNSVAGMLLALALVVLTTGALATDALPQTDKVPVAGTAASSASPTDPYAQALLFAPYVRFGLSYDMINDQLYYNGALVRYFEDFYPAGSDGSSAAGLCHTDEAGTIDVHAVRDLTKRTYQTDGSFDPSLELTGVTPYTQAEYDARTREMQGQAVSVNYTFRNADEIEWWTADDFEAWLNRQRQELPQLIGVRAWNQTDGWFVWTQEKVEETLDLYEQILRDIKAGALYSKTVNGRSDVMISGVIAPVTAASESFTSAGGTQGLSAHISGNAASIPGGTVIIDATSVTQATESLEPSLVINNESTLTLSTADPDIELVPADVVVIEKENGHGAAQDLHAVFQTPDGQTVNLGTFETYLDRYNAVKDYCNWLIVNEVMTQAQADALCARYR